MDAKAIKKAIFAAGCFWGVEEAFLSSGLPLKTRSGYSGGLRPYPSYREVCTGSTGHAESVLIEYDPKKVGYEELLRVFWGCHDPTTRDRQGADVGTQYRSAIFCVDGEQKRVAEESVREEQGRRQRQIVTQVVDAGPFYPAEEYHQQYLRKQGRAACRL